MLYFDSTYFIYVIPALLITMFAQMYLKSTFAKYSKIYSSKSVTGRESAQSVLRENMINDVSIVAINGNLTDNFNPTNKTISLSTPIYGSTSIAAVGVAAHEAGHAIQHAKGYSLLKLRNAIIPVTNIGSKLAIPLVLIGLLLPVQYSFIATLGIIFYSLAFIFQLLTLPVEFNASARAMKMISSCGMLSQEELKGARKVLTAAALTYVAAAFASLLSLMRLIAIVNRRR